MSSSITLSMLSVIVAVLVSFASARPQARCPAGLDCAALCPNFPFCHNNQHSGHGFSLEEHARRVSVLDGHQAQLRDQQLLTQQAELQVIAQQEAAVRQTEAFAAANPRREEDIAASSLASPGQTQEAHLRLAEDAAEAHRLAHFKATEAAREAAEAHRLAHFKATEAAKAAFAAAAAANGV